VQGDCESDTDYLGTWIRFLEQELPVRHVVIRHANTHIVAETVVKIDAEATDERRIAEVLPGAGLYPPNAALGVTTMCSPQ